MFTNHSLPGVQLDFSVGSLLDFQRAIGVLDIDLPFSLAFGNAQSRKNGIESAQIVFRRLASKFKQHDTFPFVDVISGLACSSQSEFDRDKVVQLIRLFRPDRDGILSKSDFLKTVDTVYKNLRRLQLSFAAASTIYDTCDGVIDGVFYTFLGGLLLAAVVKNVSQHFLFYFLSFGIWLTVCAGGAIAKCMEVE